MKPWKAILGLGAACAACCAVPLLSGAGALMVGSSTLAATGTALLASAGEFTPMRALLGVAGIVAGAFLWHRRGNRPATAAASCAGACNAND